MRSAQPFATALVLTAVGIVYLFVGFDVQSQEIPRDEYLRYIPLKYPTIVRQTEASDEMDLFGDTTDPEYQDTDPVDGIDDHRHGVLLDLAVRFAPYLVLNSTMIPMDFRLFMKREETFLLFVDTWNVSRNPPEVVSSETINWQVLARPTSEVGSRVPDADISDRRLLSLLKAFDPITPGAAYCSGAVAPEGVEHQVMFFDFPGDSEETWKQEYVNQISKALPRSYERFAKVFVHPFVESVDSSVTGHRGYAFVLQYWFFYPYNDGANNHEGDWEHINVSIKPLDKLHKPLSMTDVRRILTGGGSSDTAPDRLVIQRVDYYFHHKVMTLDYTRPNVYQLREKWETELENTREERFEEKWIWEQLRYRAYWDDDETIINTHPIGFIGGDNKGTDQLLEPPGNSNRVSNGTYPFLGLYKNVGPAGAAEQISKRFDHRKYFAAGDHKKDIPKEGYQRGSVVSFASPDRIEILPDAERVVDLAKTDTQIRRDWAWLVLPIRWGYPATESPFAGAIAHTDFGNISVLGPSYNAGWNRSGDTLGFQVYSPHAFGPLLHLTWMDTFANNRGYLNLPLSLLAALPPFDISWRLIPIASPIRSFLGMPDRIFQPDESIPPRFIGWWTLGAAYMIMSPDFAYIGPDSKQLDAVKVQMFVENAFMFRGEITFYLGERFASQNLLRFGDSMIGYDLTLPAIKEVLQLRGYLDLWEYSGSLRYNLTTGNFMVFVKGGYDLGWYKLRNVPTNGDPPPYPDRTWVSQSILRHPLVFPPNTWHFGGGIEWLPIWNAPPSSADISLRGEALISRRSIGININAPILTSSGISIDNVSVISQLTTRYVFNFAVVLTL